ncbi:hypothetical protein P8452_17119 [Trifolium repens]|nr:hypothetical protein P8452_17119 [Trifolium repens]
MHLAINSISRHVKGAYMFGRLDLSYSMLEHPTISRFHAARNDIVDFVLAAYLKRKKHKALYRALTKLEEDTGPQAL